MSDTFKTSSRSLYTDGFSEARTELRSFYFGNISSLMCDSLGLIYNVPCAVMMRK